MDTVTNIFRGYRILQLLFCHTVEGAHDFKCSQNQLELKFCLHKRHPPGVFCKKGVLKNFAIFKGKYLCQSLFLSRNFIKETLAHRFPCEFCKIFKNTFFTEHLWMTTSILQQLLALYFAIIYSWQLSSSEKSLVGKKIHPYISRTLQIQISCTQIFFFIFFDKSRNRMLYSEQPAFLMAQRHLKTMLLTTFENLNSFWNIFQETHNFLVLTDQIIICIYLRTTISHFREQWKVRRLTSKY